LDSIQKKHLFYLDKALHFLYRNIEFRVPAKGRYRFKKENKGEIHYFFRVGGISGRVRGVKDPKLLPPEMGAIER